MINNAKVWVLQVRKEIIVVWIIVIMAVLTTSYQTYQAHKINAITNCQQELNNSFLQRIGDRTAVDTTDQLLTMVKAIRTQFDAPPAQQVAAGEAVKRAIDVFIRVTSDAKENRDNHPYPALPKNACNE